MSIAKAKIIVNTYVISTFIDKERKYIQDQIRIRLAGFLDLDNKDIEIIFDGTESA